MKKENDALNIRIKLLEDNVKELANAMQTQSKMLLMVTRYARSINADLELQKQKIERLEKMVELLSKVAVADEMVPRD